MPQLSKLAMLGIAKESTVGVYAAPTDYIPFNKADYEDVYQSIKDESYRGNDSGLQGLYQGVSESDWSIDLFAFPQIAGHFLRAIIGPDTVTPGVSTTLAAAATAGATSLSATASITADSVIRIGTGATQEYATVTAVTGSGPYTLTITGSGESGGLIFAQASGNAVVSQSTHTFAQSINPSDRATYSFTIFDTLKTTSYSGAACSDLDLKIDPKSACTFSTKWKAFQGTDATTMTPAFTPAPPWLGWQWNMTNAGASSNRGLTLDWKIKRKLDLIHASDGIQSPREIFQGALDMDGSYKAIYENQTDLDLFLQWIQEPVTAQLVQPVSFGGNTITVTASKAGVHKGKRDWGKTFVGADFDISAIYNTTDAGLVSATLTNYRSTAF